MNYRDRMDNRYNPSWHSDWKAKRRQQMLKHLFYAGLMALLAAVTILYVGGSQ